MGTRANSNQNRENSPVSNSSVSSEPVLPSSVDSEDEIDDKPMSYTEKRQLSSAIRTLPGLYISPWLSMIVIFFISF